MPVPPSSSTPATFMPLIASAIQSATGLSSTCVKIVDEATLRGPFTEVFTQTGVALALGTARPDPATSGGGRFNTLVMRPLYLRIATISMLDPAGRSEKALADHWALEDTVLSAVVYTVFSGLKIPAQPLDLTGEQFDLKMDTGRYTSVLAVGLKYALPLANTCT